MTEQVIRTTARTLEMRESAVAIFGSRYEEVTGPWRRTLKHVAEIRGCNWIEAALYVSKEATSRGKDLEGVDILAMTAALVDLFGQPEKA